MNCGHHGCRTYLAVCLAELAAIRGLNRVVVECTLIEIFIAADSQVQCILQPPAGPALRLYPEGQERPE